MMEGSSSTSCLMMGFGGDNNSSNGGALGGGPTSTMMMMMPPQMPSSHLNNAAETNNDTLFLPLPPHTRHIAATSMMQQLDHHSNNYSSSCYFMDHNNDIGGSSSSSSVKAKIMAHPHYNRLLAAYINCQKIGAPPEVVAKLEEVCASAATLGRNNTTSCIGEDPALDQFMEAYCEMLTKYEQELSKPFKEAMLFLSRIECQFKALTLASSDSGDNPLHLMSRSLT